MKLQDSVIAITGGGQGLGRAMAEYLAAKGAKLALIDLMEDKLAEAADACKQAGGDAKTYVCNVAKENDVEKAFQAIINDFGHLNGLVNNAGILRDGYFHKMTYEDFDAVVKVHLYGAFNTSRAAADYFREQESGTLVHMTSTSGLIGNFAQANYSAAKLGIAAFSKSVALDLKRWNVRSNCIAPFAWSRMISSIKTDTPEQVARVEKIKEMTPAKVAPMACFLMSDRAADVSGQIFAVRKNEIFLFNQPRPVRSVHSGDGWTADEIADRAIPALKSQFTPLEVSADVFSWDPV